MSSLKHQNHRRRSHSASPSSTSSCAPDKSWRIATKRAYPHHGFSAKDASSPQKWDVDAWRRGKRRRHDISIPPFVLGDRHDATTPPNTFTTKASEFHLFSRRERESRLRRRSDHFAESHSMDLDDDKHVNLMSLSHLRSNAFWELHRSVADNGEGLIRRMRDYEHSRSRTDVYFKAKEAQKRGRKRSSMVGMSRRPRSKFMPHLDSDDEREEEDDEEDVQIFAGEVPRISLLGLRKRSASLDTQNMDFTYTTVASSRRCSSSGETHSSTPQRYHSDDEQLDSSGTTSPCTHSVASSPINPLSTFFDHTSPNKSPPVVSPAPLSSPVLVASASRAEKAIAALSLAMANGAGGIEDYNALLSIQDLPSLDNCQVGEMWH